MPFWKFADEHLSRLELLSGTTASDLKVGEARQALQNGDYLRYLSAYETAIAQVCAENGSRDGVASAYPTMRELWSDVELQKSGKSDRILWDSFESGPRVRLEQLISARMEAPSALLINSGMSAFATFVYSELVEPGALLLVSDGAYFETHTLMSMAKRHGFDVGAYTKESVSSLVKNHRGQVIVFWEPVDNSFATGIKAANALSVDDVASLQATNSNLRIVVDNTMFGLGVKYSEWVRVFDKPLVIESASKFLTTRVSAGVLYGTGEDIDRVRAYARATGVQLQQSAVERIQVHELETAERRIAAHGAARDFFELHIDSKLWASVRKPSFVLHGVERTTSLLYLEPTTSMRATDVADKWVEAAEAAGLPLQIRAGFGWPTSVCRSYGSDLLNRPEGTEYVRISVGLESDIDLIAMAEMLNIICKDLGK